MMTSKEGRFLCKVKIETAMRALRHPQTGMGLLVYEANMSDIEESGNMVYLHTKCTYQVVFLYFVDIFAGIGY